MVAAIRLKLAIGATKVAYIDILARRMFMCGDAQAGFAVSWCAGVTHAVGPKGPEKELEAWASHSLRARSCAFDR
jgi:hypothetical protein